jgi:hypothetical protein
MFGACAGMLHAAKHKSTGAALSLFEQGVRFTVNAA